MSGALGGAAGAIAGNLLYDKFGRPHESPGQGTGAGHSQGAGFPHQEGPPLHSDPGFGPGSNDHFGSVPPTESYDPNAGAEADWGGPDPDPDQDRAGGDWGGGAEPEPPDDTPGGDWGGGSDEPGGDWSNASDEPDLPADDWSGGSDEPEGQGGIGN